MKLYLAFLFTMFFVCMLNGGGENSFDCNEIVDSAAAKIEKQRQMSVSEPPSASEAPKEINLDEIKEIVWNQLTRGEKAEIIGSWEDAQAEEIIFDSAHMVYMLDGEMITQLDGQRVFHVAFESKNQAIIGDVEVVADIETGEILGFMVRD